jgi:DNA-binding beta-propeller fold protein YncE
MHEGTIPRLSARPAKRFRSALRSASVVLLPLTVAVTGLLPGAAVRAAVPDVGEIILLDQAGADGPTLYAVAMNDEVGNTLRTVAATDGYGDMVAVAWGMQKRLYVASQSMISPRVVSYYPYSLDGGTVERTYTSPFLKSIADIVGDGQGGLYVLDAKADPLGQNYMGAIFHLDPQSGNFEVVISAPHFTSPKRMVREEDGTLLVLDPDGRLTPGGALRGAIYGIDPQTHSIQTLRALDDITLRAEAIEMADPSTLLLLDSNLIVPGMSAAGGGILKLSTSTWAVLDTLALQQFGDPSDLIVDLEGNLIVLDAGANVPSGRALFRIDPESGALLGTPFVNPSFNALRSMVCLGGPEVDKSTFRFEKLNGFPPLNRGDRLRLQAILKNTGVSATGDFRATARFGSLVPLLGTQTASAGDLTFLAGAEMLAWDGSLDPGEQQEFTIELRVPEYPAGADVIETNFEALSEWVRLLQSTTLPVQGATSGGDLIVADPGTGSPTLSTPRLFRRLSQTQTERVFRDLAMLPNPVDLTFGTDGLLYVLDGTACRIVRIDPRQPSTAAVLYEGLPLQRPAAICLAHDGALLIADPKAQGFPDVPGVIYRFDLVTGFFSEFFSDPEMLDPVDIAVDTGGGYVVSDYRHGGVAAEEGRIFELDGEGNKLAPHPRRHSDIKDPMGIGVTRDNTIYIADSRGAGSPDRGAVVRVQRPNGPGQIQYHVDVLIGESEPLLVNPHGIEILDLDGDGDDADILLCDRDPIVTGGKRSVYELIEEAGTYGNLTAWVIEDSLRRPQRVTQRVLPKVEVVSFEAEEGGTPNGQIEPGDILHVTVVFQNPTRTPALGVTGRLIYPSTLTLSEYVFDETRGVMFDNIASGMLHWSGDLAFIYPVTIEADFLVNSTVRNREVIELTFEILGLNQPVVENVSVQVHAPLHGGELLALDALADPFGTQLERGALYEVDLEQTTLYPYYGDVANESAGDIYVLSSDEVLVVDKATEAYAGRGAVLKVNLRTGTRSPWAYSSNFRGPSRIIPNPAGGFVILDHLADLAQPPARGAIFQAEADGSELNIASVSRAFRWLTDMTFDSQGRLWVADMGADPLGLGVDTGAFFVLTRESGTGQYTVVDTVASPKLVSPQGLLWVAGRGLLFTDPGWDNGFGETGVRLYNPTTDSISVVATYHLLVTPRRMIALSDQRILIIDQAATGLHNEDGALFELDLSENPPAIHLAAARSGTRSLTSLGLVPTPQATLAFFGAAENASGHWIARGDTLHCEIRIANRGRTREPDAEVAVTASEQLLFDQAGAHATSGTLTVEGNRLHWQGVVAGLDSVWIRYPAVVLSTPGLSPYADQHAALSRSDGTFQQSRLLYYVSTQINSGEYVLVDKTADPLGFGGAPGAVLRVTAPASGYWRGLVPLIASPEMITPVDVALVPDSDTKMFIADANAPAGTLNRGGVFRADTRTGAFELVCQDPTFSEPRALVAVDSTLCFLLDEGADPYDLLPGPHAPGAIYRIHVEQGTAEVVFSDTVMSAPVGLVMIPETGRLILLNRMGGHSGAYAGRLLSIDPETGAYEIIRQGSPFLEPRTLALDGNGRLLVTDYDGGAPNGTVYSVGLDGTYEVRASIDHLIQPTGMFVDHAGRVLVADTHADPLGFGGGTGTIFQLGGTGTPAEPFLTGPPLMDPRAITGYYKLVPVTLSTFTLSETSGGVRIGWRAPSQMSDADFYVYRRGGQGVGGDWMLLNPHDPVRGSGDLAYLDATVRQGSSYEYLLVAALSSGGDLEFGPLAIDVRLPVNRLELERIRPNPVQLASGGAGLTIRYRLPAQSGRVILDLYDVTGRRLRRLVDGIQEAGAHVLLWNGRDASNAPVPSGVYYMRLESGALVRERRFVLVH